MASADLSCGSSRRRGWLSKANTRNDGRGWTFRRGLVLSGLFHRWSSLACLAGMFTVSALALLLGDGLDGRVLFFGSAGDELVGEVRYLPSRDGPRQELQLLVDELILGPRVREHVAVLPRSTEVRFLTVGRETVYIDLNAAALLDDLPNGLQDADRLRALASTVLFNMPWLQRVWLFVDGQVPNYKSAHHGWKRPCC